MSSLSKAFKTNTDLERRGVDVQVVQNEDDSWATFRLARAGANNPEYQRVAERIMRPFRRAQAIGALPAAKLNAITREIFAEAGVVGWQNIPKGDVTGDDADSYDKDGKLVFEPYSRENAKMLFDNLPDLYNKLVELSVEHTTYTDGAQEEDGKNLLKS